MSTDIHDLRTLALEALVFSSTPAQKERREHRDKTDLKELAASIRAAGVLQPILVRPVRYHAEAGNAGESRLEVVAGERRVLAALEAGLTEIPASVRELTDEQVTELQLIENLQREDLHELAEAEGYETLLKLGHSADDIAAKVGKSRGTVYARMKLLALVPEARKAYYGGKLSASVALLIARIPAALQKQALKEVLEDSDNWNGDGDPDGNIMSYREAAKHIQDNYMLRLKEAPFPTSDANLVPAAGACFQCPKNTASHTHKGNLELFADVKDARAGVCTDPVCFKAKREAWGRQALELAQASGQKVIAGAEAKQLTKRGTYSLGGGYVKLDERCFEDRKQRTYRELLGKSVTPALLTVSDEEDGAQVLEVVKKSDVAELLKKKGVGARASGSSANDSWRKRQATKDKKRKAEQAFRSALFAEACTRAVTKLEPDELRAIAASCFAGLGYEVQKQLLRAWGWTDKDDKPMDPYHMRGKELEKEIAGYSEKELLRLLLDCTIAPELVVSDYGKPGKPERLLAEAKRAGVKPEQVRRELEQLHNSKRKDPVKAAAPAKASKRARKRK